MEGFVGENKEEEGFEVYVMFDTNFVKVLVDGLMCGCVGAFYILDFAGEVGREVKDAVAEVQSDCDECTDQSFSGGKQ